MSQDLEKENDERIYCNLVRVEEAVDGLNAGQYLEIKLGTTFFVLEEKFLLEVKNAKDKRCPIEQKQQKVSVSPVIVTGQDQLSGSAYKDVLNFIIKDIFGNNPRWFHSLAELWNLFAEHSKIHQTIWITTPRNQVPHNPPLTPPPEKTGRGKRGIATIEPAAIRF